MNIEQVLRLRESGHVERAHTVPHHGSYNVAMHSWHAAGLLLALHPNPSVKLLKAVLLHDVPERWTGDMPRHASPYVRSGVQVATEITRMKLGIAIDLTTDEYQWLYAIDGLEFFLWCEDQLALGNQHVRGVRSNQWRWFAERWVEVPEPVEKFLRAWRWKRTNDSLEEEGSNQ